MRTTLKLIKPEVAFQSPGAGLRGVLLEPRNGEQTLPAIVMAPGMSGVKEGLILQYAKYLARGGFAVLAYDNISFGRQAANRVRKSIPATTARLS
jgi:dienelactone hydrolase